MERFCISSGLFLQASFKLRAKNPWTFPPRIAEGWFLSFLHRHVLDLELFDKFQNGLCGWNRFTCVHVCAQGHIYVYSTVSRVHTCRCIHAVKILHTHACEISHHSRQYLQFSLHGPSQKATIHDPLPERWLVYCYATRLLARVGRPAKSPITQKSNDSVVICWYLVHSCDSK